MDYSPIKRIVPQTAGVSAWLLLLLLIRGAAERTWGEQGVGIYLLPQQPFAPSLPDPSSPIRAHRGWVGPCWSCSPRRGGSEAGKRVLRRQEDIFSGSKASCIHPHAGMNWCSGTHRRVKRAQPPVESCALPQTPHRTCSAQGQGRNEGEKRRE